MYSRPINNMGGDVFTVEEFKQYCQTGAFVDYDGYGYAAKNGMAAGGKAVIQPSKLNEIPDDATHIVWFNR